MRYVLNNTVEAKQLTEINQEEVAKWCNGVIKGTRLQPIDRVIEFKNALSDSEEEASVSEFIIKFYLKDGTNTFSVVSEEVFNQLFVEE